MRKKVKLVHGFNVFDDGENTIDRLVEPLEGKGYEVDSTGEDYGWTGLLLVYLFNGKRASHLVDNYKEGEIVIAHSNGCAITARAIDKGLPVKHVIFIHPALDDKWEPLKDSTVERIDVYYSERDVATKAADFLERLPGVLWGNMGTIGPTAINKVFVRHDDEWKHSEGFSVQPSKFIESL